MRSTHRLHPAFGKVVFVGADLVAGALVRSILNRLRFPPQAAWTISPRLVAQRQRTVVAQHRGIEGRTLAMDLGTLPRHWPNVPGGKTAGRSIPDQPIVPGAGRGREGQNSHQASHKA